MPTARRGPRIGGFPLAVRALSQQTQGAVRNALLTALFLLPPLLLFVVGCPAPGELDYPYFLGVHAECSSAESNGSELPTVDLSAELEHERGEAALVSAWVEVYFAGPSDVEGETILTFGTSVELASQGEGLWKVSVESGATILDCDFPDPYYFVFVAEDDDGQLAYAELVWPEVVN